MDPSTEARLARLERSSRRSRLALVTLGAALAAATMLGLQNDKAPKVEGFSTIIDQHGALSHFRLLDDGYVETLDTTRGDRWDWRRIRNWPRER